MVITFVLDSLKRFDINTELKFVRLSVSDYFRSRSVGWHHSDESDKKATTSRFASI